MNCQHLRLGTAYRNSELLGWKCLDCSYWLFLSDWIKMQWPQAQATRPAAELVQEIVIKSEARQS